MNKQLEELKETLTEFEKNQKERIKKLQSLLDSEKEEEDFEL
jgi:hypothetical protein